MNGFFEVRIQLVDGPRRLNEDEVYNAEEAYKLLYEEFRKADREITIVLCLDANMRPINFHLAAMGTIRRTELATGNIFKTALLSNAAGIVLAHNHPSGDPEPSESDYEVTRQVMQIGDILGIPLLDHIVIGEDRFISIFETYKSFRPSI